MSVRARFALLALLALAPAARAGVSIPLVLEENRGQLPADVRFAGRSGGARLAVGADAVAVCGGEGACLRLTFPGGEPARSVAGEARLPGLTHYFRGADPSGWIAGVPTFGRVRLAQIWPGIDAVFYGNGPSFEFDFELEPGANPELVQVGFEGAAALRLIADGRLQVELGGDALLLDAPVVYQDGPAGRERLGAAWRLLEGERAGFELAAHDRGRALVIDPVIVGYASRLGGSAREEVEDLAVDAAGFVYVGGHTESPDLMGTAGAAGADAFVVKLAPGGQSVVYTAVLGGAGFDKLLGLAVDGAGRAHVSGQTQSADFPTLRAWDASLGGMADAFFARLGADGALQYSTYFGGAGDSDGLFNGGVALDPSGIAWVTGRFDSPGLATAGAFQSTCSVQCAFVAGFDANASGAASRVYTSTLDGPDGDAGLRIAVDAAGRLYVVGFTGSDTGLVDAAQGFQTSTGDANNRDHFLVVLDPARAGAAQRVYSTYIGGLGDEPEDAGLAIDGAGRAWVSGDTTSTAAMGFPLKNALQPVHRGDSDGYALAIDTRLAGAGSLLWGTYLGGASGDSATGLARDAAGNLYVGVTSSSADFPRVAALPDFPAPGPGSPAGVLVRLDPAGSRLELSTPLTAARRLATDAQGRVWVAGHRLSAAFPPIVGAPTTPIGVTDVFLARLDPDAGLKLEIEDSADPVRVGDRWLMRYLVTNQSAIDWDGVTVDVSLPAGATGARSAPCLDAAGGLSCALSEPLGPGENAPFFVELRAASAGSYATSATASGSHPDLDPGDNAASQDTAAGGTSGLPAGPLRLADFDAVARAYDIGGFAHDVREGVLASASGSLGDAVNLMRFDAALPVHVIELLGQGELAFGFVERASWTPADGDGADLFGREFSTPADRVFALVRADGTLELWSAAAFSPGIRIARTRIALDPAKPLELRIGAALAELVYDGQVVAQANPFTGYPAADPANLGDDQVISVGYGHEWLGAAVISDRVSLDADSDGVGDAQDSCPHAANGPAQAALPGTGNQTDRDGDGIGDACECGDANTDGELSPADVNALRSYLIDPLASPLSAAALERCNVIGVPRPCDLIDLTVLRRHLDVPPRPPGVAQVCRAAVGP
jgi:hypothetical protein